MGRIIFQLFKKKYIKRQLNKYQYCLLTKLTSIQKTNSKKSNKEGCLLGKDDLNF